MDGQDRADQQSTDQQSTLEELRDALSRIESGQERPGGGLFSAKAPGDGGIVEPTVLREAEATSEDGVSRQTGAQPARGNGEADAGGGDYEKARAVVLRKLTGSPKTRHQLAEALREREFAEEIITEVLDRMEEVGLLDDADFARTWVRSRHELKGLGRSALRRELTERGVAEEHIEPALEQLSAEDESAAARAMVEKKLGERRIPPPETPEGRTEREKLTRRLVAMLARRGHSPGDAFQIVRDVIQERTST